MVLVTSMSAILSRKDSSVKDSDFIREVHLH